MHCHHFSPMLEKRGKHLEYFLLPEEEKISLKIENHFTSPLTLISMMTWLHLYKQSSLIKIN